MFDEGSFQGELPELALLDIRLPGEINGVMVGERLRESEKLGQIAIVLTTAWHLSEAEKDEAIEKCDADLWLPKPLPKFNELQGILEGVIAKRREARKAITKPTKPTKEIAPPEEAVEEVVVEDKAGDTE